MARVQKIQPVKLSNPNSLRTLTEHRRTFMFDNCELNVFETYQQATSISLKFNDRVLACMMRGKKEMRLSDKEKFNFLPGESILVNQREEMIIDFPEAEENNPTQCIALALDEEYVKSTIHFLNEKYSLVNTHTEWDFLDTDYHFQNDASLAKSVSRIVRGCIEGNPQMKVIMDLQLQELLVRIMQSQQRQKLQTEEKKTNDTPLNFAVHYIKSNIDSTINVEKLSALSNMSNATFYRTFKRVYGVSPMAFILMEKLKKAKQLLLNSQISISEVCYSLGYSDVNYFHRIFKKYEGITPGSFRLLNGV